MVKYKTLAQAEDVLRFENGVLKGAISDYTASHNEMPVSLQRELEKNKSRLAQIEKYNSMWKPQIPYKPPSRFDRFAYMIQRPRDEPVISLSAEQELRRAGFTSELGTFNFFGHPFAPDSARSQMTYGLGRYILWGVDERRGQLFLLHHPGDYEEGEKLGNSHVRIRAIPKSWMNAMSSFAGNIDFYNIPPRAFPEEWQEYVEDERTNPNPNPAVVRGRGPEYISVNQFLSAVAKPGRKDELRGELERLFTR